MWLDDLDPESPETPPEAAPHAETPQDHDGGFAWPNWPEGADEAAAAADAGEGGWNPPGGGGGGPNEPAAPRPRRRRALRVVGVGLLGAIVGASAMMGVPAYRVLASGVPQLQTVAVTAGEQASGAPAVAVYNAVSPSVVLVTNQSTVNSYYGPQNQTAWGSGVIFESDGYIVTNDHVVNGAQKVTVTLKDGTSYPAKVVGGDPSTDLAVIKISAGHPLPAATFANSNDVVPGELAVAIGNPLGPQFADTVTQGIVGAMRPMLYGLPGSTPRVTKMIQVDAPINPGNSGGALANAQGEVIGITSMKVPQTGEMNVPAIGLGFAIPSNTVKRIVNQILQTGTVAHAWIGIVISPTPANALPNQTQTLTITGVEPGSPAAAAHLQKGDVILSWNTTHMLNYYDLVEAINRSSPGDTIALGIDRNGTPMTVHVKLGNEPQQISQPTSAQQTPAPSGQQTPFPFPFPFPSFGGGH